jgi:alpha-tubulin suppressor-like RCC1 family protein
MALTKDGKLFGWGYSENGRLGEIGQSTRVPSAEEYISKTEDKYSRSMLEAVQKMVEEKIKSEDNMPIIWEPSFIHEVSDLEVSDVSCGLDHSLILCCEYSVPLQIKPYYKLRGIK